MKIGVTDKSSYLKGKEFEIEREHIHRTYIEVEYEGAESAIEHDGYEIIEDKSNE